MANKFLLSSKIKDLFLDLLCSLSVNDENFHFFVEKLAAESNVDGCLDLISSENPQLDTSLFNISDGWTNILLQFVLNSSAPNEAEVLLKLFGHQIDSFFSVPE